MEEKTRSKKTRFFIFYAFRYCCWVKIFLQAS